MKATELRIGNWIQCVMDDGYTIETTVTHLPCSHFANYEIGTHITDEHFIEENFDVKPIPLTEEWLERFGFVHNDKYCRFDSRMWNVRNRPEGKEISMNVWRATGNEDGEFWGVTIREELTFDDVTPVAIQHVHTLQNLYFALTGKELNQNK